ncbi:hypothetical protein [Amycolatopsis sp. H20-H5]|uniref:hypothetical protein n=1 Tax=Amycolatopsis sp. H20-H5 TaxID=3046309 RepID=UPI002DB74386|nr:hypothetical protein [Amycolatopsis sp. H20-H5]MEC3980399.1 hypothetical protein [Amycolatopsis sp. H20-H5]
MADESNRAPANESPKGELVGSVWLPPKPDPVTGQPFPPQGPAYVRSDQSPPEFDRGRDTTVSGKHRPPPDQGPTLAWYRSSRRKGLIFAVVLAVVVVGIIFVSHGFVTDWLSVWWMWLLVAGFAALMYFSVKAENCAAGAEWVMENKTWIRTYELRSIKAYTYSNSLNLHFVDSAGRTLKINLSRLQDDRRIWDLVYNGILHSVVKNAADTNQLARGSLKLPESD